MRSPCLRRLFGNIGFLLAAASGLGSQEQNAIVRIFSDWGSGEAAPNVERDDDGMNFELMPEQHRMVGYATALVTIFASAVVADLRSGRQGCL